MSTHRILAAAVVLFLPLGAAWAQESLLPRPDLKPLEQASLELARAGRADEWREVVAVLVALGLPEKDADAHRSAGERLLAKARKGAAVAPAAKRLHDVATAASQRLASLSGEPQRRLAEQLLRLDGDLADAHEVLGHERYQGVWSPPGQAHRDARRREIAAALAQAMKLELPIVVGPSDDPLLSRALGRPGTSAKLGAVELHSGFPAARTERMLRQTMRAAAFVHFLETGELAVPDYPAQRNVLFPLRQQYVDAVRSLQAAGTIKAEPATVAAGEGMYSFRFTELDPQLQLCSFAMEGDAQVMWLTTLEYWRGKFPCLIAGRVNFACRTLLGQPMPRMAEMVTKQRPDSGGGTRAVDAAAVAEREHWLALAPAGMRGGRLWMRYLLARGEAPKWQATMHEQLATIQGDELLKATLMVDFLGEEGLFAGLAERAVSMQQGNQADALAKALGTSLPELEQRWELWLLGLGNGLVQRLQQPVVAVPPAMAEVLVTLQRLRRQGGLPDAIEPDAELSDGCRAHALYLKQHRDQAALWPDCHEEYADREGWTAAGAMAGHASVIISGVTREDRAIDAWMATFYHRLPLLDPGLRRIGYAREGDVAVLDSGSMVDPRSESLDTVVLWPFDGMTGTPTSFAPEMPNPVPDEDQSKFGYPITVQCSARSSKVAVDLHIVLREKDARGAEVPCWWSSPQAPSNPVLAPANSFCLIPKAPLRKGATYWVEAEFVGESAKITWTFRT